MGFTCQDHDMVVPIRHFFQIENVCYSFLILFESKTVPLSATNLSISPQFSEPMLSSWRNSCELRVLVDPDGRETSTRAAFRRYTNDGGLYGTRPLAGYRSIHHRNGSRSATDEDSHYGCSRHRCLRKIRGSKLSSHSRSPECLRVTSND